MFSGSPTADGEWSPVGLQEVNEPKYAILNNDNLVMLRDDDFSKRVTRVSTLEDLAETFRNLNPAEHPGVKAMIADSQKAFEEEHKDNSKADIEDAQQQPLPHGNGMPDEMIREKLLDGQKHQHGAKKLEDSVMDYISENFLTEEKEGEEDDSDEHDWIDDINQKEEL